MPQSPVRKQAAPAEVIESMNLGYNTYTDPTLANPKMWAAASNVYSSATGHITRARFANVVQPTPLTGKPFLSMKYFALPGLGAYLLGDIAGFLYSYDTSANYAQTQRINPYVDPNGQGTTVLNGPWSREVLGNIVYEMNGQVKMAGRNANGVTIEGFGLDAPDASPQIVINSSNTTNITSITRSNGVVTVTVVSTTGFPTNVPYNVAGVTDTSFDGSFTITVVDGTHFSYTQFGQNTTSSGGTVNTAISKSIGRSYCYAWENANKSHVGAPSPVTQYIDYNNQNGTVQCIEPGLVSASGNVVSGAGTFFTPAWIGRNIWIQTLGGSFNSRIVVVNSPTSMTLAANVASPVTNQTFQIYDPQATHIRLYETADGGATYFRVLRNPFNPAFTNYAGSGLSFSDDVNAEPPNAPFTTETAQFNNVPPPVGSFVNEYQGRLCVFGVPGALQSIFYSNQETTTIGLPQESFAPLNQITLPIANAKVNGMLEFPGDAVIWSDKQDMFRLTGLLADNTVTGVATANAATQQGASISRLPYNLGIANPFACDITPLGGFWVTSNLEVWLFTDKYAPRNIGRPVQAILNSISPTQLGLIRVKYYHNNSRNWLAIAIPANQSSFNNTLLILDLDLLSSNGSPSYFTFDMATNSPAWWVYQPGRCDFLEVVYENAGIVRLMSAQTDLIQDMDYFQGGFGTEIPVNNASVTLHAWGNDHPFVLTRPAWLRFNTNRDPAMLQTDGWSFAAQGIDDDFYTFQNPLTLSLTPGVNDSSTNGGNPDFLGGLAFRHSPELYKIAGVNFVMGRRLRFQCNFPSGTGNNYEFRSVQIGYGSNPPS